MGSVLLARRGWKLVMNDLSIRIFGIQDAALMAENMARKWRQWFRLVGRSSRPPTHTVRWALRFL
jgi:hypothetical protein